METYVFDGHNAIFSVDFLRNEAKTNREQSRFLLLNFVQNFKLNQKIRKIVVFDGSVEVPFSGRENYKGIEVYYSKMPFKNADALIVSLLEKEKGKIFLVTDDRELISKVKSQTCKAISPKSIFTKKETQKINRNSNLKTGQEGITQQELDEFLALFGAKE
ncbi:NYN domain-containing protein [bacterium]|nr:NYN domain-containing protein [bacterium]